MKNIAILTGGLSAERGIALQSAQLFKDNLDTSKYQVYTILLNEDGWFEEGTGNEIDLKDFTLLKGSKIVFDYVFLVIHGHPAENGLIQGYFEMRNIPHSTCDTLCAALTFDKFKCKHYLSNYGFEMAGAILCKRGQFQNLDTRKLRYPAFVKPNKNGSSYGVTKVSSPEELEPAIRKAFKFDDEVLVEDFVEGVEYSIAAVRLSDGLHVLPATEIKPKGDFFDYEAKYLGASEEITPAPISAELLSQLEYKAKRIYEILDCRGVVRVDFIRNEDVFYFLEINTIPGMSAASIVPQQILAYGWSIQLFLDRWIDATLLN